MSNILERLFSRRRRPSTPQIPVIFRGDSKELVEAILAIKQILEVANRQSGDIKDSFVTVDDLVNLGIVDDKTGALPFESGGKQQPQPAVWGMHFHEAEDLTMSSTIGTAYVEKLKLTTSSLPLGRYRIGWAFSWSHNDNLSTFLGRVQVDDSVVLFEHQETPSSSTSADQKNHCSGFAYISLTEGSHTVDIDFASAAAGVASSIWNARLELWRVS